MILALTLMVRDEVDIISSMIDHHVRQGVDRILVTDNGSVDGTAEILRDYAQRGIIDLRHDPVHQKQQGTTVTEMARDAARHHGADWVINADADEFWVPRVGRTLKDVFSDLDPALQTFTVPVYDMIGQPAQVGSGLQRLVYRDRRPTRFMNEIGIHSHATTDAVHIGRADIVVAQGNHFVNIESRGIPPQELEIEVLHFPWRSWRQFKTKVENAGRAYANNPNLMPSPNHHGMREYKRLDSGILFAAYLARHPTPEEVMAGLVDGTLEYDGRVSITNTNTIADEPLTFDLRMVSQQSRATMRLERQYLDSEARCHQLTQALAASRGETGVANAQLSELDTRLSELDTRLIRAERERELALSELNSTRSRRIVKVADRISKTFHRRRPST